VVPESEIIFTTDILSLNWVILLQENRSMFNIIYLTDSYFRKWKIGRQNSGKNSIFGKLFQTPEWFFSCFAKRKKFWSINSLTILFTMEDATLEHFWGKKYKSNINEIYLWICIFSSNSFNTILIYVLNYSNSILTLF
jgi:hypothetical protein